MNYLLLFHPQWFTVAPLQLSDVSRRSERWSRCAIYCTVCRNVPIVGACVSVAVIVCVTVALCLPQASVASHERVILYYMKYLLLYCLPDYSCTAAIIRCSGGVNEGVAVQSIVLFAGTVPIVGACVSLL
jgi:hypothetical protein